MIASMFAKEIGRQRKQIQSHLARLSSSSFILQCFDRRDSKLCRETPGPSKERSFRQVFSYGMRIDTYQLECLC